MRCKYYRPPAKAERLKECHASERWQRQTSAAHRLQSWQPARRCAVVFSAEALSHHSTAAALLEELLHIPRLKKTR